MRSSYRPIGNYIRLIDERNNGLHTTNLLGVSISKQFIKSVANVIGTDMENYKIIRKNQFACSIMQVRRDRKMPVALYTKDEPSLISQAYPVFEIINSEELLPEYLMMWFTRSEFDREACFHAVGGVRGSLEWEDFCNMQLPIPSPEKQLEIVSEYNVIQNRIKLNNHLINKLEETAQAVYKQWFVDFEFPDGNGLPYKTSGGEMVESEMGEIPRGWRYGTLNELSEIIDGDRGNNYPSSDDMTDTGFCLFLNAGNVTKMGFDFSNTCFISEIKDNLLRKGKLKRNDVILTTRGTVGNVAYYSNMINFNDIRINSGMVILREKNNDGNSIFIYSMLRSKNMKIAIDNYLSGSAQPQLPIRDLVKIPIIIPDRKRLIDFANSGGKLQARIDAFRSQNLMLIEFNNLLLAKMTKVEVEKEFA